MLINKNKIKIGVTDILFVAVSALFLLGIKLWFPACGEKADGTFMTCHWAGEAVSAAAITLLVISVLHCFLPDAKIKAGISFAAVIFCVFIAVIPEGVIDLCMMDAMQCRSVMKPWTTVFSVAAALVAASDAVFYILRAKKENNSKK